jgi:hypothetical protein
VGLSKDPVKALDRLALGMPEISKGLFLAGLPFSSSPPLKAGDEGGRGREEGMGKERIQIV